METWLHVPPRSEDPGSSGFLAECSDTKPTGYTFLPQAMVESGRVELLMHPLTQTFLEMKWQAYGRYIHLSNLFVYLVYLFLVTVFAVGVLGNNSLVSAFVNASQHFDYSNTTDDFDRYVYKVCERKYVMRATSEEGGRERKKRMKRGRPGRLPSHNYIFCNVSN
nr:transient receptor potential cation channel subfamily A member 1-like [Cherax quadricarinatus]